MLRDRLIDTATKLGIDDQLRGLRAAVHPVYRHQHADDQKLRVFLRSILTRDSNCIDVGVYRGRVLAEIIQAAPYGRHIAYEPLPERFKSLIRLFPSVDIRMAAVSNQEGETTFVRAKRELGRSGFSVRGLAGKEQVEQLVVRTAVLDRDLPVGYVPALIKVDVEGAERQVFEGAIDTIVRYKPVILFEHGKGGAPYYGTQPKHIYGLLHDTAGLQIFDIDGNGPYSLDQFEDEFERDERWDYIARPL